MPKIQNVGKSLPFVLKNFVIKYAYFDGIAYELLAFSSPKILVSCFKYQEAGAKLK
ncbi:hypothetical protein [Nostoc sp.]|uniref:hypothetical protein n=1 Tax=Nostoc sp. TaxID=1180 RepID=UPI002FF25ABE